MEILQLIVSGLSNGCVYGLIALGFVLIYKATEQINFAQGDMMMLGASSRWASATRRISARRSGWPAPERSSRWPPLAGGWNGRSCGAYSVSRRSRR